MEEIKAWRTSDGVVHTVQYDAEQAQALLDLEERYSKVRVYESTGSIDADDMFRWLRKNRDLVYDILNAKEA